ncbi:MAG: sialate O-acetylesterase [Armatimonadota bacterium]
MDTLVRFGVPILSLLLAGRALAEVRMPSLFSDNMVLQRGLPLKVRGWADPGERVVVELNGQKASARAGADGRWTVRLKPMDAGGPYTMTIAGKNTLSFGNVVVGEVWVCSGQSNMEWPVAASNNAQREVASADYPMIRLFTVPHKVATVPQEDTAGKWEICSPRTVGGFSAVGYFFGREIHKRLGVPVGLINTSWGGTPAEAWTSRSALESEEILKPILERWDHELANYPQALARYREALAKWEEEATKARQKGKTPPEKPKEPGDPTANPWLASGLYNGMIAPLTPYAIRGAIWYQGESNADRAYQYRTLFPAMIRDWRRAWQIGNFPFFFVQLANFMDTKPEPADDAWAELREAQLMTLSLPKTGMAVTIDIGDAKDIHPRNKQDVGYRLALAALKVAYGQDVVHSGPLYKSMKIEGDKVRIRFTNVGGGLVARGGPLKGFAVAGADRKFVWANAEIDGDTVVVWSEHVPKPVAVRYAWASNPVCNLYNAAGLPASPFRTDDWPGVTVKNR